MHYVWLSLMVCLHHIDQHPRTNFQLLNFKTISSLVHMVILDRGITHCCLTLHSISLWDSIRKFFFEPYVDSLGDNQANLETGLSQDPQLHKFTGSFFFFLMHVLCHHQAPLIISPERTHKANSVPRNSRTHCRICKISSQGCTFSKPNQDFRFRRDHKVHFSGHTSRPNFADQS